MVEHIIEQTAQKVKENQNLQNTDYLDAEGLCWCGICGERKENRYKVLGHDRILPCLCRCDREKLEAQKEEERKQDFAIKVSNLKSVGLTEPRFREWRFENDNGSTPKLDIARQYVENWKDMQQRNIGYVLMGPVGTGKSFFAGCIANALMEQGIAVMMTNFSRILNELTKPYADKNEFISHLVYYPLLIIDDLGIERKVKIFRYVTESTFDSYMWQLIENKQKFISQIMTSKAPVRSCEDVDEAALSYAEVKALATGNPAVKEKMSLDVEVAKLKLLKANHLNNVYRMEADISRNLPQKIAKLTEIIEGYREDIAHYEAHKITDPEAFEMEIGGKIFTEKKEAGAALLAVCKQIQSVNEAKDVGNYQGFHMMARFDSWNKEFILSVKHTAVSSLPLGSDPLGNIARINNLLESYPKKLADAEQKLETVKEQLENAKQEVAKPFPKEKELNRMMERLSELNALLNMDEQGSSEEPENSGKQSIHDKLNAIKQNGQQEHDHDKPAKGNDIDRS